MKNTIPRLSVIVSIYNGEKFLNQFLENVLEQTCISDIEVLLLDAQSTDSTKEIIQKFKHDSLKYHYLDKKYSIYETWNIGVELSNSKLLSNWNIDDRRKKNSLETQISFMENNSSCDVCYGHVAWSFKENEKFEENLLINLYPCHDVSFETMMENNSPHCMPVWKKDLHKKFGLFDTQYATAADFDFWMKCIEGKVNFQKLYDIVGLYYYNPNGLSTHMKSTNMQEGATIKEKYKHFIYES
jgi:glycosyltransferase involved in cell wall biosynthesis